jgi:hypothetical protein
MNTYAEPERSGHLSFVLTRSNDIRTVEEMLTDKEFEKHYREVRILLAELGVVKPVVYAEPVFDD